MRGDYHLPEHGEFIPERFLGRESCVSNDILYDTSKLHSIQTWGAVCFRPIYQTDKPS